MRSSPPPPPSAPLRSAPLSSQASHSRRQFVLGWGSLRLPCSRTATELFPPCLLGGTAGAAWATGSGWGRPGQGIDVIRWIADSSATVSSSLMFTLPRHLPRAPSSWMVGDGNSSQSRTALQDQCGNRGSAVTFPSRVQKNASFFASNFGMQAAAGGSLVNFSLTRNAVKVFARVKGFKVRKDTGKITLLCVRQCGMRSTRGRQYEPLSEVIVSVSAEGIVAEVFVECDWCESSEETSSSGTHSDQPWSKPQINLCVGEDGSWTSGARQRRSLLVKQCVWIVLCKGEGPVDL